ncbi:transporter substrate-binding domain-containing protein [Legionella worsleiensis]|uniref:Arginine 3rd transport system periplasmic binding protein n=1 Tax=Legionella worsleiensis TaxID=45076 RepID=A0A0W1AJ56_9GAMM|nr:transporter substrate-binding domain-containing protein [Legionella worsleiensis]KTD81415.1 arginine 3rd transport system periplasmic binding protein [Legionella worsleiensis]STY30093.1 arginine 3rd transport system periplasmic binding protein [Legionella worsleiensis]
MKTCVLFLLCIFSTYGHTQTLTIGSSKFNPPFETWASHDASYFGYDIDLMTIICKRLKATCKFKAYTFNELFGAIDRNEVDLIIASMIITKPRQEQYLFSLPYLESYSQYITSSKNASINNPDDLYGKKIGVRKGTPYGSQVLAESRNNTIVYYPLIVDIFVGLQNKEIDAFVLDYEAAKYWIATNPGIYKLIGNKIPVGEGYAVMTQYKNAGLVKRINDIILQMGEDGTFIGLYSKYFGWNNAN